MNDLSEPATMIEEANISTHDREPIVSSDVCALPLVRRVAATLDLNPAAFHEGAPLPRGWHLALFSTDTPTSALRMDGMAGFGVPMPDLNLPRVVFGGREINFHQDIPVGAHLTRLSQLADVTIKQGHTGRFAVLSIEHQISIADQSVACVTERHNYILRDAATSGAGATARPAAPRLSKALHHKVVIPDEIFLFRVSAVMFNPHRIHYDARYCREQEGYRALVVNGSASFLLLMQFFAQAVGTAPKYVRLRNLGLAYCGEPLHLHIDPVGLEDAGAQGESYRVWASDGQGQFIVEGVVRV